LTVDLGWLAAAPLLGLSIISGTAMAAVFRRFCDQAQMKQTISRIIAHLLEFQLFLDEPLIVLRTQRDLLAQNLRLLRLCLRPILVLAVPFFFLFAQLNSWYGHAPLELGKPAIVTVEVNPRSIPELRLRAPDGIRVETEGVRALASKQVSWRIRPLQSFSGRLQVLLDGRVVTKTVAAGFGFHHAATVRHASIASFLADPVELPFRDRDISSIEVRYPRATVLGFPWLVWFLTVSGVAAMGFSRLKRLVIGAGRVAFTIAFLGAGTHPAAAATVPPQTPVILISIDTLRADHLSSYGYRKIATPNIDAYAEGGTLFSAIDSQIPLTLPSHTVLFTSTYPFQNRIEENAERVPAGAVTLTSVLRTHGYATGAFIGSVFLERQLGLDQGFDQYDSPFNFEAFSPISGEMMFAGLSRNAFSARERRDAALVIHAAGEWLKAHRGQPVFVFVHLFDLHEPYRIPAQVYRQQGLSGYDAELKYLDRLMGSFRQTLEKGGWWDRSLVVVLSDHGEGLDEHGEESHGYFLYQSTLWVPLLIHWPQGFGSHQARTAQPAGLIDVAPTILDFLRLPPPASFEGRSLLPAAFTKAGESRHAVYSETLHTHDAFGWAPLRSIRIDGYKYIEAPKPELYDLGGDPNEHTNLIEKDSAKAQSLRAQLAKILGRYAAAPAGASKTTTPQTQALLGSLGYLSDGPGTSLRSAGPDPKDRLPEYRLYKQAMLFVYDGRYDRAIPILKEVLTRDPHNLLARRDLGASYLELRDYRKARFNLEQVIAAAPGDYQAHYELGLANEHLGRLQEAIGNMAAACKLAPDAAQCRSELERLKEKAAK
jgi:choline-sulfatase